MEPLTLISILYYALKYSFDIADNYQFLKDEYIARKETEATFCSKRRKGLMIATGENDKPSNTINDLEDLSLKVAQKSRA
jgi:hypothetical protein